MPPGSFVGRYLIIEEVGRGGMGIVQRAYDPKLQREVALKLVRTDAEDEAARARLVREARAMARVNHPNVVGVYDVEVVDTSVGDVVLVMEYVRGKTLRAWLSETERSVPEILEQFVAAGRGLAAAHAEGLLHRDFKLGNVLVGADGRTRVSDFGLARTGTTRTGSGSASPSPEAPPQSPTALNQRSDPQELDPLTARGVVMGTPVYMAPEQADARPVDARADQFAFCVALWRALTKEWPFEGRGYPLQVAKLEGAGRWPSTAPRIPRHVERAIRRGLSPHIAERWPAMDALLAELTRDPRARRWALAIIGIASLAVVGVGSWRQIERAQHAVACQAEGDAIAEDWNDERASVIGQRFDALGIPYAVDTWDRARAELDRHAEEWAQLQTQACEGSGPIATLEPAAARTARACLADRRHELSALVEQLMDPDLAAAERVVSATTDLERPASCVDPKWLRTRPAAGDDGSRSPRSAQWRRRLAESSALLATGKARPALDVAEEVRDRATEAEEGTTIARANLAIASAQRALGAFEEARSAAEAAFHGAGAEHADALALDAARMLASIVGGDLADHDEALLWCRIAATLTRRLELEDGLAMATLLDVRGGLLQDKAKHADAGKDLLRALEIRERELGPNHPRVAATLNNLGRLRYAEGDYDAAVSRLKRSIQIREDAYGPEHPDLVSTLGNLATAHVATGQFGPAMRGQERILRIRLAALGSEHPDVATSWSSIGVVHKLRGEREQAEQMHRKALELRERVLPPNHPDTAASLVNLGNVLMERGELEESARLQARAVEMLETTLGPEHPDLGSALVNLANIDFTRGRYEAAGKGYARALAILEQAVGPDHPTVSLTLNNLGNVRHLLGDLDTAARLHRRALAIQETALGTAHPRVGYSLARLADVELARERLDEAKVLAERALSLGQERNAAAHEIAEARYLLAQALWKDDAARAAELASQAIAGYDEAFGDDEASPADARAEVRQWLREHPRTP